MRETRPHVTSRKLRHPLLGSFPRSRPTVRPAAASGRLPCGRRRLALGHRWRAVQPSPNGRAKPRAGRAPVGRRTLRAAKRLGRLFTLNARARGRGPAGSGFHFWAGQFGFAARRPAPAPGRPRTAMRRRKMPAMHEPVERRPAVWRAWLPDAVKPFLAMRRTALRCPTCKAWQVPALQCRRCKCDLSLVVAVHDQKRRLHAAVLRHLAAGDYLRALATARARWDLAPDAEAARLLIASFLPLDRFQAAEEVYENAPPAT